MVALLGAVSVCVLVSSTLSRRVGEISLAVVSPKGGKTQDHQVASASHPPNDNRAANQGPKRPRNRTPRPMAAQYALIMGPSQRLAF